MPMLVCEPKSIVQNTAQPASVSWTKGRHNTIHTTNHLICNFFGQELDTQGYGTVEQKAILETAYGERSEGGEIGFPLGVFWKAASSSSGYCW